MSIQSTKSEQKLAWVTGASSGTGRALALALVREGYSVVVTARNHDRLVDRSMKQQAKGGSPCSTAMSLTLPTWSG